MTLYVTIAGAQESTPPPIPAIEVHGIKDPEVKPYRTMLKGADAFEAHRILAPDAPFRLILRSKDRSVDFRSVALTIVGKIDSVQVPIADDGSFYLPRLTGLDFEDAELVLNRRKAADTVRWRPFIRTPNLPPHTRRLGDLRLECEIQWAIERDDLSFVTRNAFKLLGGPCRSARVQIAFEAETGQSTATLTADGRRMPLNFSKRGDMYVVPVHDMNWPDDALIELSNQAAPNTDI